MAERASERSGQQRRVFIDREQTLSLALNKERLLRLLSLFSLFRHLHTVLDTFSFGHKNTYVYP